MIRTVSTRQARVQKDRSVPSVISRPDFRQLEDFSELINVLSIPSSARNSMLKILVPGFKGWSDCAA